MTPAGPDRPNLLLVVLDCGRWFDLPGGPDPVSPVPFLQQLFQESINFPRSVAPSPWTIPSHASLFTGLYPWDHGAHLKAGLVLDESHPTLASRLREAGYGTLSVAANGFVSPDFGLVRGFEAAAWGDWWERFLHRPDRSLPTSGFDCGPVRRWPPSGAWPWLETLARAGNRFPVVEVAANRMMGRLRQSASPFSSEVASWIEPTVARWLEKQPASRPVFTFVNYMEPHEPYIIDPRSPDGGIPWSELADLRMDWTSFLSGSWRPTPEQLDWLRRLYRAALRSLDRRLERLVGLFKAAGRWENTVMVLTSDHGQAFGERGYLFHASRLWEPVVRIPLWVRFPDRRGAGRSGTGWASLVDVAPTLLQEAGVPPLPSPAGLPLGGLTDQPRPGPVYTIGDGSPAAGRGLYRYASQEAIRGWDQPVIAAYAGDWKFMQFPEAGKVEAHDLRADPSEGVDAWPGADAARRAIVDTFREPLRALTQGRHGGRSRPLQSRLQSWGYD